MVHLYKLSSARLGVAALGMLLLLGRVQALYAVPFPVGDPVGVVSAEPGSGGGHEAYQSLQQQLDALDAQEDQLEDEIEAIEDEIAELEQEISEKLNEYAAMHAACEQMEPGSAQDACFAETIEFYQREIISRHVKIANLLIDLEEKLAELERVREKKRKIKAKRIRDRIIDEVKDQVPMGGLIDLFT